MLYALHAQQIGAARYVQRRTGGDDHQIARFNCVDIARAVNGVTAQILGGGLPERQHGIHAPGERKLVIGFLAPTSRAVVQAASQMALVVSLASMSCGRPE